MVMTERKIETMNKVYDLRKHLQASTVKLVEAGYSDTEIKLYFKELVSETTEFVEEYWAL